MKAKKQRKASLMAELSKQGWAYSPILPRYGIYLTVRPSVCEVLARIPAHGPPGQTFAGHFRRTWGRLPLVVRRRLLAYWRTWPPGGPTTRKVSSRLRVLLSWPKYMEGNLACCEHEGWTLSFCGAMDRPNLFTSDEAARTIAHELAHAYRWVTLPAKQLIGEGLESCEIETRELAESWGFPQDRFDRRNYRQALRREAELQAELEGMRHEHQS
jgi:hypothetical protein